MRFLKVKILFLVLLVMVAVTACSGQEVSTDKTSPTTIEIWTYYMGDQKIMFDKMTEDFNQTVGAEKNIIVSHKTFGDSYELDEALLSAVKDDAGALNPPNMFITYRGIDHKLREYKELIDFYDYYSDAEIDEYIDAFIEMGVVHDRDTAVLNMFPIAKSQNILMINDTDFQELKQKIDIDYDDLSDYSSLIAAAKKYYDYTDSLTDTPHDGKALFGVDSVTNYFLIGVKSMGNDLLIQENGKTVVNLPKESARVIWDNYYVPMIKGYFGKEAKFATADIKVGKLLISSGSTAGTLYFPKQTFTDDVGSDIEMKLVNAVHFAGKEKIFFIQGGGIFALKNSDEARNIACVEFIKWITAGENNATFAINSGYLPVTKAAFNREYIDQFIKENHPDTYVEKTLRAAYEQYETMTAYAQEPLFGYDDVRHVIREEFDKLAKADANRVRESAVNGEDYQALVDHYLSDQYFDDWYESFMYKVNTTLADKY